MNIATHHRRSNNCNSKHKTKRNKKRNRSLKSSTRHSRQKYYSKKNKRKIIKGGNMGSSGSDALSLQKEQKRKNICSPLVSKEKVVDGTCIPEKDIKQIKDTWNAHSSQKISAVSPTDIWKEMYAKSSCQDDLCVLSKPEVSKIKKTMIDYYAPKQPDTWKKNPTEWLTNIEILEKMKQYEKAYKCFKFIGPTPIDFDTVVDGKCVENSLCHFDLKKHIDNGIKKIGIIFNTDPHDKGGEHWISLFINIKNKFIFFFDSAGNKIPNEIKLLVNKITEQGKKLNPPINFAYDDTYPHVHQQSNTECGMYSLYFIINMLEDKLTREFLKTKVIPDEMMINYRKLYFN